MRMAQCPLMSPTGLRTAMALAPLSAGCMPPGLVILTAKPIAGHDAKAQRREPGEDDPDAAGAEDLDPERRQALAPDHRRAPHPADGDARERRGRAAATAQAATAQQ